MHNSEAKTALLDASTVKTFDLDNYTCIEILNTASDKKYWKTILQKVSVSLVRIALLYPYLFRIPSHRKMKNILCIHNQWNNIEAICTLFSRRNRLRLFCSGKPEIVALLVSKYRPHEFMSIIEPTLYPFCKGKEIIEHYKNAYIKYYVCLL